MTWPDQWTTWEQKLNGELKDSRVLLAGLTHAALVVSQESYKFAGTPHHERALLLRRNLIARRDQCYKAVHGEPFFPVYDPATDSPIEYPKPRWRKR